MHNTCLTPWASVQHLLPLLCCRQKPTTKRELQWLPAGSYLMFVRLDPGAHLSMAVQIQTEFRPVWPHSLSQHIFLTLSGSLVSINYIVSGGLHTLDSLDPAKSIHVQIQFLTAVSPQHPAQDSHSQEFSVPGQDRSWRAQSRVMHSPCVPEYKKNTSADPVLHLCLGAENQGKGTGFSGSQRQSASHPTHGKSFLLFPSAVHTEMLLPKNP